MVPAVGLTVVALVKGVGSADPIASVLGALSALAALLLSVHTFRRAEAATDPSSRAKALSRAVLAAETRQRAQLIGAGAHRIDLSFIHLPAPANNAAGAAPNGRLADVADYYRRLRPARLVITGEPGAGKTLLAIDLVLGLLTDPGRNPDDPVPVRCSLASWDPASSFRAFLTEQIHEQFRSQGISHRDAQQLVDHHQVIPVLDGLDEMDRVAVPIAKGRAVRALEQLNTYQAPTGSAPVILTCRTERYTALATLDVRLRESTHIEITHVPAADAIAYLTARVTDPDRWQPVLDALRASPTGPLARALGTPWSLNLAVAAYEERDPDTLAHVRAPNRLHDFTTAGALRTHLLSLYLPATVRQHPTGPNRYCPEQVERWLTVLARHLTTTGRTDFVPHAFGELTGLLRVRLLDAVLTMIAAVAGLGLILSLTPAQATKEITLASDLIVTAAVIGGAARIAVKDSPPRDFRFARLTTARSFFVISSIALGGGMLGLLVALAFGLPDDAPTLGVGAGIGIAVSLPFGLVHALVGGTVTADRRRTIGPRGVLRRDLATQFVAGPAIGALAVSVVGLLGQGWFTVRDALDGSQSVDMAEDQILGLLCITLAYGAGFGLTIGSLLSGSATRRYFAVLLLSRRLLPWKLIDFLEWAHEAGLLRMSGDSYQFRHKELQDWLSHR
ncbi:NACHT domain-containing protein [Kitasatospora sp. NPDC004272]